MPTETIHALATAPGRAGIAVVRVSGPKSPRILEVMTGRPLPDNRQLFVRKLISAAGEVLDQALVLSFPNGHSFTGEDVVEFHLHGSRAVVSAVLREIDKTGLSRPATAGEFTRRALQNDRLDLLQVQGLGQLIDAETELQRKTAVRLFDGDLGDMVRAWRRDLVEAASLIEATLDFADEDVPEDVTPFVKERLDRVRTELEKQLLGVAAARRIQDGFLVVIFGAPNSGKSSLINILTRSDAAIVSDIPGTTRDIIEVRMEMEGLLVRLVDTAGLRETVDPIERVGVDRAKNRIEAADFRLLVLDSTSPSSLKLDEENGPDLVVRTKSDLSGSFGISAVTGEGIGDLVRMIGVALAERVQDTGLVSAVRDERVLREAAHELQVASGHLRGGQPELMSESLRAAMAHLSEMIGDVDIEDILDHIFRSFCIGK
ncbi:MAG: tRNA uridine-5-carboxymethylaminomethyl(34) synthesis GTPase MnmE [Pseudomonadota bacterium]